MSVAGALSGVEDLVWHAGGMGARKGVPGLSNARPSFVTKLAIKLVPQRQGQPREEEIMG